MGRAGEAEGAEGEAVEGADGAAVDPLGEAGASPGVGRDPEADPEADAEAPASYPGGRIPESAVSGTSWRHSARAAHASSRLRIVSPSRVVRVVPGSAVANPAAVRAGSGGRPEQLRL